ncbi:hypothetical protein FOZ63_013522 [Perkinsus olseni]|uniref:Uncharacterized protein n=1 Tax=Perkinsus olseni TaxID=32597 RepID=A0A7J6QGW5_PEROL|nr:hypothetical protein FOZ62_008957 [Perkinsus olseni]KAF4736702.1 hypothetical protein FOZ63_013522 [Perkinsus olseni]
MASLGIRILIIIGVSVAALAGELEASGANSSNSSIMQDDVHEDFSESAAEADMNALYGWQKELAKDKNLCGACQACWLYLFGGGPICWGIIAACGGACDCCNNNFAY